MARKSMVDASLQEDYERQDRIAEEKRQKADAEAKIIKEKLESEQKAKVAQNAIAQQAALAQQAAVAALKAANAASEAGATNQPSSTSQTPPARGPMQPLPGLLMRNVFAMVYSPLLFRRQDRP